MSLDLDRLQQRIVGVLVEKEHTVPESYPLTLNALVSGCNQKSNRNPVMSVEPYEIEGALHALMDGGWVVRVEMAGARTHRYEHRAREQLGVDAPSLAILVELMIRGPQTPGELKTRASRMVPFHSPAEVEARLLDLAERPVPYVERLERRPREHAPRWRHLIGAPPVEVTHAPPPDGESLAAPPAAPAVAVAPASYAAPPAPAAPAPAAPAAPVAPAEPSIPTSDLIDRIDDLERRLEDLTDRLDRLEGR